MEFEIAQLVHNRWRYVVRTLSLAELRKHSVPVKALVEVANNGPLWTSEQIQAYRLAYAKAHEKSAPWYAYVWNFVIDCILSVYLAFCAICSLVLRCCISCMPSRKGATAIAYMNKVLDSVLSLLTSCLMEVAPQWRTNQLRHGKIYARNYKDTVVPDFVQERVKSIQALAPDAKFFVSFFGTDPILEVHFDYDDRNYVFHPLVWDEVDGKAFIVSPPVG